MIINFKFIFYLLFLPFFLLEILVFKFFKFKNSNLSFKAMIFYFCITGGWSNHFLHKILKKRSKLTNQLYLTEIEKYNKDGFFLKENFLNKLDVNNFKNELTHLKGFWLGDDYESKIKESLNKKIKSTKFYYNSEDLIKLKSVQKIISNNLLINLASKCLDAEPILYNINCWYSFPSTKPDIMAAQKWHFDMDRPKWVKLFFYLTDCDKDQGPHSFVKGTHKNSGIPSQIRNFGYKRINDEIILRFFDKNDIVDFTCSEGDLLFEDTRGLHKGTSLNIGKRLLFQIEFTSSLFGGDYHNTIIHKNDCSNEFKKILDLNRHTFQSIKII